MADNDQKTNAPTAYPFKDIEPKWRKFWEENKLHKTDFSKADKKLYSLVMFSYPSGDKLHVGHWYNFAPADTWTRKKKMEGYNTFEPMGYDAFGLPAENYAIKTGIHPAKSTKDNIEYIRKQLKEIGAMYDWDHELSTCDPEYYKWTQWLFLRFFEKGMAVRKEAPVNWCPSCKTVLANEQVVDGKCERCDTPITRKNLKQWFLRITEYADRLLEGLDKLDWPAKTIAMQRNWIGRSEGTEIIFKVEKSDERIPVFTTRADTLFGVTYVVLAPEHPMVQKLTAPKNKAAVDNYIEQSRRLSEIDRLSTVKEKTGVFLGSYCINPINGRRIPIWTADYVLYSYGTGAVMAVPGHDERDWEFAAKFGLEIKQVIAHSDGSEIDISKGAYVEYGKMINSGEFDGLDSEIGIRKVTQKLNSIDAGDSRITYKLRDWLISRQRYWGAPIPIIVCPKCGDVAVPDSDLPILLPKVKDFRPTGEGKSPLASSDEFVHTKCPICGGEAERETETMDTFVDSSWYFIRYVDPHHNSYPWNPELVRKWLPVDMYIGGAEHTVMHLMYARFFCMYLHDIGLLPFAEPFLKLRHQGTITNKGDKMSKSRGNVVSPEQFTNHYGSDTFRMYLMFMGSYSLGGDWDDSGINGVARFLNRVYRIVMTYKDDFKSHESTTYKSINDKDPDLNHRLNLTIKRVTNDIDNLDFNTAIAACMELVNDLYRISDNHEASKPELFYFALRQLILILAPLAPHLCEELWHQIGGRGTVFAQSWPKYYEYALEQTTITVVVQVNSRLRGSFNVPADINEDELFKLAAADSKIAQYLDSKEIVKKIFIPGKLLNIVVK